MELEEQLKAYSKKVQALPEEKHIQETIQKSRETFYAREQEKVLTYQEFLWVQLNLIQKRWWLFQVVLLFLLWVFLSSVQESLYVQRSMGITASLFVIFVIPEFWKNRTCQSMEIEAASYYSLNQIYSARMLLFGMVDMVLIVVFCGAASVSLHFALTELLVQFLFPLVVTACICFGILCSKHSFHEMVAIALCIIWSAVWWLIILNDNLYSAIVFPLWLALFGIALVFLSITVYRSINGSTKYLEVNLDGIESK